MFSKNTLIVIGVIVVVLLLGLIAVLFTVQNQNDFEIGGKREPESVDSQQFTDELLDAYTIDYPSDWNVNQQRVAGGGTNTTFTIPGESADAPTGLVTIQGVSADDAPLDQVERAFEAMRYERMDGSVQDVPAMRFAGSLNRLHEVAYVFEKDNIVYTLKLSYVSDTTESNLEQQFSRVADTFSFN